MPFSTLVLRHILGEAERSSTGNHELLTGVVDFSRLQREDFWIQDHQVFEVVRRALHAAPVPAYGLRLGQRGSFMAMGAVGLQVSIVPTFRGALEAMTRTFHLVRDEPDFRVSEDDQNVTIELGKLEAPLEVQQFMNETLLRSLHAMVAQFGGAGAKPRRILFCYPAPPHVADYHQAFGCELHFDQPRTAMVVDRAMADKVQILSQPDLADQLQAIAERQFAGWARSNCLADQVRAQLRKSMGPTLPSMVHVAHCLGMSERSLRRQLAREGVDFRSLVKDELQEVANRMLTRKGVAMKQVAHDLGYRSVSAFHRAFKRWTGASPSAFAADTDQARILSSGNRPDERFIGRSAGRN